MAARDPMMYRELPAMPDGFVPAVERVWIWTGRRFGKPCRIPCRLTAKHPTREGWYYATALFDHNVQYLCRDLVSVDDLEPGDLT